MGRQNKKIAKFTKPEGSEFDFPWEEYIYGPQVSLVTLGKKWKIHTRVLATWSGKDEWVKKRKEFQDKVEAKQATKLADKESDQRSKLVRTYNNLWLAVFNQAQSLLYEKDKNGRPKLKDLTAADLNLVTLILSRAQEYSAQAAGINLKVEKKNDEEDKNITLVFGFGADDDYRSTV